MSSFLDAVMDLDEDIGTGADGVLGGITTFYDTGSYSLNAQISGSIYGGFPNKITGIAGEPATGKTFFALIFNAILLALNVKLIEPGPPK